MNRYSLVVAVMLLVTRLQGADPVVAPLLTEYCISCHDGEHPEGEFSLDTIDRQVDGSNLPIWRMVYERVRFGEMPPPDAKQLDASQRGRLLTSIRDELLKTQRPGHAVIKSRQLPRYGNDVDHTALFNDTSGPVIPGPPRVWRLRPPIYDELIVGDLAKADSHQISDPLNMASGSELKDYAVRYFIDESSTSLLLSNAKQLVKTRSRAVLDRLTNHDEPAEDETVDDAIRQTYRMILLREPTAEESSRFGQLYRGILEKSGGQLAAERMLMAIYMQPDALFREELGSGPPDEYGRVRLSQREIALAVSYALDDSPDQRLLDAAEGGKLATRDQVAAHVNRRFELPPKSRGNPRILQFFREYFHYPHARDVFKNPPLRGLYLPDVLTNDLDLLIDHIVRRDEHVLRHLLTTNECFVDCRQDPGTGSLSQSSVDPGKTASGLETKNPEFATVYGLPRDWIWTDQQPIELPLRTRSGVLTHPAWLAAWSGNFDNHPVQRGKWIRTHLLGGTVPDVPINVDASVPEDSKKQFRERLAMATAGSECQRCHKKMDPLGMPFEQYDHYGRYRRHELDRPIDTSGAITYVEDETLGGEVADPIQLMHRLAKSEHVEQVFVRYVFRYFMGRNETLGDAKTLQEAHQAYRNNRGSFRALVVSLLTSDSFLYRSIR